MGSRNRGYLSPLPVARPEPAPRRAMKVDQDDPVKDLQAGPPTRGETCFALSGLGNQCYGRLARSGDG